MTAQQCARICILILFFACAGRLKAQTYQPCGTIIATSYNNIPAYSNGPYTQNPGGLRSCDPTGKLTNLPTTYGLHFQCVELVRRFYAHLDPSRFGPGAPFDSSNTTLWHGNANTYWYGTQKGGTDPATKGLISFSNDGTSLPTLGDIIVFDKPQTVGHVAIVNQVSSTSVTVIEQNWSASGAFVISVDVTGKLLSRKGYVVLGWLRSAASFLPPPPSASFSMSVPGQVSVSSGSAVNASDTLTVTVAPGQVPIVSFDGSSSTGTGPLTFKWTSDGNLFPPSAPCTGPTCQFGLGVAGSRHTIALVVTDAYGQTSNVAVAAVNVTEATVQLPSNYQVTDLGAQTFSKLNNIGQAAGSGGGQLAVWTPTGTQLISSPNGCALGVSGFNDNGVIVGTSLCAVDIARGYDYVGGSVMFLQQPDANLTAIPTGINDSNQIGGYYQDNVWNPPYCAFSIPLGAQITSVNACIGTVPGILYNDARAGINSAGHLAGATGTTIAYEPLHPALFRDGTVLDLGILVPAESGYAVGINDTDHVVGIEAPTAGDGAIWRSFYWDGVSLRDLGTLEGANNVQAVGLNNSDQVIGLAVNWSISGTTRTVISSTPFIWTPATGMHDLTSLVSNQSPWTVTNVEGINNLGQILATCVSAGVTHSCLLTPQY